ncbi:MAG: TetR/AcrR family transcriptional regulator [Myxococcaceae bacterium]
MPTALAWLNIGPVGLYRRSNRLVQMARPRFATAKVHLRERILDAAVNEFAQRGYEAASLNRILLAAGLSKGSFYYYFDDKADLAATVIAEEAKASLAALEEMRVPATADEFWAELRRSSLASVKLMCAHRTRYDSFVRLSSAMMKDAQLVQRVLPLFAEGRKLISEFMGRGQQLGAVRSDLPVAALLEMMQSVKMAAYRAQFPGDQVPTQPELEAFTDLVIDLGRRLLLPSTR